MSADRAKALPKRTPKTITVRDNVPPDAAVVMSPAAAKALVRLFGEEVLRRVEVERGDAGMG